MLRFAYVVYARLFARYNHSVKTSKYTSIPVIVCTYVVKATLRAKAGATVTKSSCRTSFLWWYDAYVLCTTGLCITGTVY